MPVIQGFSCGTVILFSGTPPFPPPPVVVDPNDQPASEIAIMLPQAFGIRVEYVGPLSADMGSLTNEVLQ